MENILDNFQLPANVAEAGAREDIARMNLQMASLQDGVQVISGFKKDGVPYRFFIDSIYNHRKSLDAGYEVYDEVESVEFLVDKKTKPAYEIKFLDPDRLRFNLRGEPVGGSMFEDYKRWKAGQNAPGTAIAKWEVLSPAQVRTLESEHIFTIEQLAALPAERIREVFRNNEDFIHIHERAILWQGNKDVASKHKEQLDKLQTLANENKQMRAEMEALREQIKQNRTIQKVSSKRKTKRVNKRVENDLDEILTNDE